MKILGLISVILTIFGGVALVSVFALHHQKRKIFCGFAAAIFSVIMYGSPLSVLVPNGFGCALGILQLIFYAVYCGDKGEGPKYENY